MRSELESVLASPVFARSPVQAQLLSYLVEASIDGRGKDLKSYSLAVEALGKSPDFDSQADSYARVQVGRVRKSLDTFYSSEGADHSQRLWIEAGSYEVRLVANQAGKTANRLTDPGKVAAFRRRPGRIVLLGAVAAIAAVVATAVYLGTHRRADPATWQVDDFPTVEVTVHAEAYSPEAAEIADVIRDLVVVGLSNFETTSVSSDPAGNADYEIEISVSSDQDSDVDVVSFLNDRRRGKVIWSDEAIYPHDDPDLRKNLRRAYAKFPLMVAHATGLIHSNERKFSGDAMSPYLCWLRFSALMYDQAVGGGGEFGDCAEEWYSATPDHPIAAALYGWSLTDKSLYRLTEDGHRRTLEDAVGILQNARGLHPESAMLQVATVRVFAFSDERDAMIALADRAVAEHPVNIDVLGFSGLMLALHNDPRGEGMIQEASARHFNPPPWYFVGLFMAAMMRDDDPGAQQALENLSELNHSLAIRPILAAASEAHSGQLEKARKSWEEAKARQPVLRVNSELFFARVPLGPEVTDRLKEWLAPVR
ncbi:MAG: hypothetical protein H6917_01320 [Novosphingobium sp.]|nr:hypothetical protein [Novosphingobium sp.]MCP5401009.1 hypothetical protein [Novosphingobium sp.]